MITLHHLEYSQSFRILWLLEELEVEYQLKQYGRDKKTNLAPDDYKALSPLGTAPVITDGDLVLSESNAIIDYILDKYPHDTLRPSNDSPHRARYLFWFHSSQGSMMPLLLMDVIFRIISERVPFFLKPIIKPVLNLALAGFVKPRMTAFLRQAEIDLAEMPWFGGNELTAADIALCYSMESAASRAYINENYPNCEAWLERAHAHPSFLRAQEKDGKPSIIFQL